MKIYSIYDSKAEAYLQPLFANTNGVAIRIFSEAVSDENHAFNKYAADYTLFEIGTFDENSGNIEGLKTPKSHVNALTIKSAQGNENG